MKKIALMLLVLFLVGCSAPAAQQTTTSSDSSYAEPAKSTVVTPATPTKTQTRTSKVYYFVMTVDEDGFDPNVLTVPWSERSKITLTNEDSSEHSFDVAELGLAYTLKAKETIIIDFVPPTRGEFKIDDRFGSSDGKLIVGGAT